MCKIIYKTTLAFFLFICAISCEKKGEIEEPIKPTYTKQQKKAFAVFDGTFKQVAQYDFLEGLENTWVFKKRFDNPKEFYAENYMNGKEWAFTAHGECTYIDYTGEKSEFFYHIDEHAVTMKTYKKQEKYSPKEFYYHKYTLEINDIDNFVLFYDATLGAQIDKYKRVK